MKNWTDYDTFLMHLECTIENIGINAIKHQDQEKVHEEALKAVEFICATIERQKGREEKTIKTGKQHEPINEVQTKPCNIYDVSQRSELLLAFVKWLKEDDMLQYDNKHLVDWFIKANNCG